VTGRPNYKHWADKLTLDLVRRPDTVSKDPALATAILVRGMKEGSFRNRRLD
jgi:predicted chitinase